MNKKLNEAALLAAVLSATAEEEKKTFLKFNMAPEMPTLNYNSGIGERPFKKTPLSKQQQKRRAANKRAKQSRKRNR